jgi:hypothetical protein
MMVSGRLAWNKRRRVAFSDYHRQRASGRRWLRDRRAPASKRKGSAMSDAQYYRQQLAFSVRMAELVTVPETKARWLKLAQQWRELAERAETPADGSANELG